MGLLSNMWIDFYAAIMEFFGTTIFLFLGLGSIQSAVGAAEASNDTSILLKDIYVATCMGLSLIVSAWIFFRVTGGVFNPNLSLALFLIGGISPVRFVLYCIAQLAGAVAASGLILVLTPGPIAFNTTLQKGVNSAQGVFIEMFITAALVLSLLMLAAEKHIATPFAPIGIGLTLFVCHLFAVFYTGAAMNTARAFGPAVVTGFQDNQHWVYWVGPCLGSFLGVAFYTVLKHYKYWEINPDQATNDPAKSPEDPVHALKSVFMIGGQKNKSRYMPELESEAKDNISPV